MLVMILQRLLTLIGVMVAVMVALLLLRCSQPPMETPVVEVEEESLVAQEEPDVEEPEPVTEADIHEELLGGFEEEWPSLSSGATWDACAGIIKLSQHKETDPIIMADEVTDLTKTLVDLQPLFAEGREGGLRRALGIAWDLYRGVHGPFSSEVPTSVRDLSCRDLDEGFEEDNDTPRINAYILAVMGYRESRLMKRTELGYMTVRGNKVRDCRWCRGSRGEEGMFQFMPRGYIRTFMPGGCSPFDRMCSVRGAARALAHIRCMCIDQFGDRCNMDTYVAGYGMTHLPDPSRARHSRGPRNARRWLCEVRDDCDELWPTDHDDDFALSL